VRELRMRAGLSQEELALGVKLSKLAALAERLQS
jgi:DNA-binding XRE family transcriptional regulator